jgi:hypothetical protein
MSQPVIIENDAIRMEVYPHIGGKVASLIDKADKFDLMFDYPVELPTGPRYDVSFDDSWYAGWDECFPAVAPGQYPGHPYEGINIPDHGELWGLPTTAVPTKAGITTVWHGLRFGYRLTRKLHLEDAEIIADYTLINLAPFQFRFVWSMHSLMSMASRVKLSVPTPAQFRFSHDAEGMDHQKLFDWPAVEAGLDVSDLAELPIRRGWKMFSMEPITAPVMVEYPARGRSLKVEYSSEDELPAYWGIWVNTGGWAGNQHFAIEPTTGRFDHLHRAVQDASAGQVGPMGRRDWSVKWTLGGATGANLSKS